MIFRIILFATTFLSSAGWASDLAQVEVLVKGMGSQEGQLLVALEKSPEAFRMEAISRAQYRGKFIKISGPEVSLKFEDVPPGEYAIKVFHDKNMNQRLDLGIFGIPKESYGFSRGARSAFGPPDFSEASFLVGREDLAHEIIIE